MMRHKSDLLGFFAHHKVAANLVMLMMIMGGGFALHKLNIRYFPNFDLDFITIRVIWRGASAEDVEATLITPLEQALKSVDNVRTITSKATQGLASISIELNEGSDTVIALNQVKQKVDEFRNLPTDAEEPRVVNVARYEQVARLLLYGPDDLAELRNLAHLFEQQLLDRGIDKIDLNGLPDQELSIELSHRQLQHLGIRLTELGQRIDKLSRDIPAGTFGQADNATELRSIDKRRSELGFARLPIISNAHSRIELGHIAAIKRQNEQGGVTLSVAGKPAVEMVLRRTASGDSFRAAEIFQQWLNDTRPALPEGVILSVYDETWQLIEDRINLLIKNGGGGLVLVVAILYLFLSPRVAGWVAIGIPVSFMATLLLLYIAGGSINMISLFALIMALGIIVDDAIVVGEDALAHYQAGEQPLLAAEGGARRMFAPVIASSLTTIAAFLPLMLIGGPTGKILFEIPLVIVTVIMASVIESFFVLPGHLRHSFIHMSRQDNTGLHQRFNQVFETFKKGLFKNMIGLSLRYRAIALSLVCSLLIITAGLLAGDRLKFNFFPSPESTIVYVNVSFVPGTPRTKVERFLQHLQQTLYQTERQFAPQRLIKQAISRHGTGVSNKGRNRQQGDHTASMTIELTEPDHRNIRNNEFIQAWKRNIQPADGLDSLTITPRTIGPPGRDLTIRLTGGKADQLKQAALRLAQSMRSIAGVSDVEDNMPYGHNQRIFRLTPAGEALGLTGAALGQALRAAFDGELVQLFQDGADEIEVRVKLARQNRDTLGALQQMQIRLPDGHSVPLGTVAEWRSRRGFENLRHADGKLAVEITAQVDARVNNTRLIIQSLKQQTLPQLVRDFGIDYSFEGRSADQKETLADMKYGLIIGLMLIYLVLAWVFASYGWPLVVMCAIPFGLIGALFGHLLLNIDLTILSLFGFFGLSGIVVNDSIILVSFYQKLRNRGMPVHDALIEASCQRLRAVLLTSLTTIAGLAPLLFETSLQAQFLIPMAVSIAFGLMFATILVLLIIPVLLSYHEDIHQWLKYQYRQMRSDQKMPTPPQKT